MQKIMGSLVPIGASPAHVEVVPPNWLDVWVASVGEGMIRVQMKFDNEGKAVADVWLSSVRDTRVKRLLYHGSVEMK